MAADNCDDGGGDGDGDDDDDDFNDNDNDDKSNNKYSSISRIGERARREG